jgi:hypothetical protein
VGNEATELGMTFNWYILSAAFYKIWLENSFIREGGTIVGYERGTKRGFERFETFTAVTMKNGVFLDVTPCGSCKNPRFGGT